MKLIITTFFIFLMFSFGLAQKQADEQTEEDYSVSDVRELLKMEKTGFSLSWWEKANYRLGDRVSIALLKIYDEQNLKTSKNIKVFLPVIRNAFFDINMVETVEDKKPKITLFLLHFLEKEVTDQKSKVQIAETIKYVEKQTAQK